MTVGAEVILTDLDEQLDLCTLNAERNESIVKASCGNVTVLELDWTQPLSEEILHTLPLDVVLCSDIAWHVVTEHVETQWIKALDQLCGQHTIVIHIYEPRGADESHLMYLAKDIFNVQKIDDRHLDYSRLNRMFYPLVLHVLSKNKKRLEIFKHLLED